MGEVPPRPVPERSAELLLGPQHAADLSRVEVDRSGKRIVSSDRIGVLHIKKAGGDVDLDEAPEGAVISTAGGAVTVGRAAGLIEAKTGGGDIEIGPVAGSVRAGTGAGDIHVTLVDANGERQTVELTSGNGRMIVELPADFDGTFELETAYTERNGATRIESAWDLKREATKQWDGREGTPRRYVRARGTVGSGRGHVRIKTVNGDIEVRRR